MLGDASGRGRAATTVTGSLGFATRVGAGLRDRSAPRLGRRDGLIELESTRHVASSRCARASALSRILWPVAGRGIRLVVGDRARVLGGGVGPPDGVTSTAARSEAMLQRFLGRALLAHGGGPARRQGERPRPAAWVIRPGVCA